MQRVAKILPLPVDTRAGDTSMRNALAEKGFMRFPGTGVGRVPVRNGSTGEYLTGLNENAQYIKIMAMTDPEAAMIEARIVKERRLRLEAVTGLDLGPRSRYYADVYDNKNSELGETASRVKLVDGDNVFNFSNPHKEIEFWWLSQLTDLVAPSLEAWKAGKCKSTVQFYISDPGAEASAKFQKNMGIATAIQLANTMTDSRKRKVAKLLGLPVTDTDDIMIVYNEIHNMISEGVVKAGEHKGQNSVELFNRIAGLNDKVLNVRALVKEALLTRIYTERNGVVYEGEQAVAKTREELISELCLDSKAMELLALETKLADKKKMTNAILNYDYASLPDVLPVVEEQQSMTTVLDDGFEEVGRATQTLGSVSATKTATEKPKQTMSAERLAKMQAGRAAAKAKKEALKTQETENK